jgi:DNA-binding MarR family transcriptional regulator
MTMAGAMLGSPARVPDVFIDRQALRYLARQELAHRRNRLSLFDSAMFGEPAWDMLLILYAAQNERRYTIGQLTSLAEAPGTTALRWLKFLTDHEFVERESSVHDMRVVYIRLSDKGLSNLDSYFYEALTRDK